MSAAHTCFRSVLTQAFRPSTSEAAASWSLSAFLVPACTRLRGRLFSSAKRRRARAEIVQCAQPALEPADIRDVSQLPPKPTRPRLDSCIPFPAQHARADIQHWLRAIDPFLPPSLRRSPSSASPTAEYLLKDVSVAPIDIAVFLVMAQNYSHDILSHLGLKEQRWDTVVWIAKKLVGEKPEPLHAYLKTEPFANAGLPGQQHLSLEALTNDAFKTQLLHPLAPLSSKQAYNLDDVTSTPETVAPRNRLIHRALGQLWRSLGSIILEAADDEQSEHALVMHRVLEILAYLHHMGFIPDSVYAYKPEPDNYALQQPPTLHLLSSKILTALSDAQWRAHEASVKVATERLNASYFLGHEIPGSRYKVQVTEVAPELWLELVLWSCLHGGWILDGSAILERIASHRGKRPWVLAGWKEMLKAEEEQPPAPTGWNLFRPRDEAVQHAEARVRMQRKISSEVVTAIVDGLVNDVRVGVGERGSTPEHIVERIKSLKRFLDSNSLSLGSTTWDSIMTRLLESGSIIPEKKPELLLNILDLASEFGSEVSAVNASSKPTATDSEPPYFFEPTVVSISLLHQTMRSFIQNGDIAGAMSTLQKLQDHTDHNKQKSLKHFFETLKTVPLRLEEPFSSRLPPIEFPAFENQLPVPLLAKLLDLVTDAKMYDLGRWLLYADDLDGPLIRPGMYGNFVMAAAIIRFGTMAGEHDLVLKIVSKTSTPSNAPGMPTQVRMPHEFFTALMCSQIKLHRWKSVHRMQNHVLESPGFQVKPEIVAQFAAELLRLSGADGNEQDKSDARTAFTEMLFTWESLVLKDMRNELYCILGILCSVHAEWNEYCSQFLAFSAQQGIKLSTNDFNNVLSGVLDGYGSSKAREVVDMWCYKPPRTFEQYRAPGGLPTMPKFRPAKGEEYESRPDNIEIHQASGAKLILLGRIHPNRQTVWAILRKVQQEHEELQRRGEEASVSKRAGLGETLKWAVRLLYYMGFDNEDIMRDLGSLAELADVEAPPAPKVTLRLWEDGAGL